VTVAPALPLVSRPETAGVPYLTTGQFLNEATGVQTDNLVPGGTPEQQTAALASAILQASSWMDGVCWQVLGTTTDTEVAEVRARRDGWLEVFPRCFPIRGVTGVSLGSPATDTGTWTALTDLSGLVVQTRRVVVGPPSSVMNWGWPVQFGPTGLRRTWWVQLTYVNGYPVTTLTAQANAASVSLQVANGIGIAVGMPLTISDGMNTETVTVSGLPGGALALTASGPATLTVPPTIFQHGPGIGISNLPVRLVRAAILATSGLIRSARGTAAFVMPDSFGSQSVIKTEAPGGNDLADAMAILVPEFRASTAVAGLL